MSCKWQEDMVCQKKMKTIWLKREMISLCLPLNGRARRRRLFNNNGNKSMYNHNVECSKTFININLLIFYLFITQSYCWTLIEFILIHQYYISIQRQRSELTLLYKGDWYLQLMVEGYSICMWEYIRGPIMKAWINKGLLYEKKYEVFQST